MLSGQCLCTKEDKPAYRISTTSGRPFTLTPRDKAKKVLSLVRKGANTCISLLVILSSEEVSNDTSLLSHDVVKY